MEKADQGSAAQVQAAEAPVKTPHNFLTKDQILAAQDIEREDLEVPEWGGWIQLRAMTGSARDRFESKLVKHVGVGKLAREIRDLTNVRAFGCSLCIVVPGTDELMFTQQDIVALGKKSASALDKVFSRAMRISKITEEEQAEIESFSEREGGDGEAAGSPSGSD